MMKLISHIGWIRSEYRLMILGAPGHVHVHICIAIYLFVDLRSTYCSFLSGMAVHWTPSLHSWLLTFVSVYVLPTWIEKIIQPLILFSPLHCFWFFCIQTMLCTQLCWQCVWFFFGSWLPSLLLLDIVCCGSRCRVSLRYLCLCVILSLFLFLFTACQVTLYICITNVLISFFIFSLLTDTTRYSSLYFL
jgi:hypothetical protein